MSLEETHMAQTPVPVPTSTTFCRRFSKVRTTRKFCHSPRRAYLNVPIYRRQDQFIVEEHSKHMVSSSKESISLVHQKSLSGSSIRNVQLLVLLLVVGAPEEGLRQIRRTTIGGSYQ